MRFYELVMTMEEESKHMIANMIRIRNALEQVKKQNALLLKKSETDALTGTCKQIQTYRLFTASDGRVPSGTGSL